MSPAALIEIDFRIATLREQIATGEGNSQTLRVELMLLLDDRAKLIEAIAKGEKERQERLAESLEKRKPGAGEAGRA